MMAKMFYTMDEARSALGKDEEEIRQYAREGRLREFRDGPRLMFKADQVEQLRAELMGGIGDQVDLGMSDSGGLTGLVDTTGASGTSITLSDTEGAGGSLQMKDDTALAADLGLSGSLGGVPSPAPMGRGGSMAGSLAGGSLAGGSLAGSMASGTGLGGSMAGRSGMGINVFGSDDIIEPVDPMAQTAISGPGVNDQIDLGAVGSGSGLLDLTRESDDTSLGAVLDEITPAPTHGRRGSISPLEQSEGSLGASLEEMPATARAPSAGLYVVEREDPLAPAFGGMALGGAIVCVFGLFVLISALYGTRPDAVVWFQDKGLFVGSGIGFGLVAACFILGLALGRMGKRA